MYWESWLTWRALGRTILPRGGGFEDQPDAQIQVFMLLDSLLAKIQEQSNDTNTGGGE